MAVTSRPQAKLYNMENTNPYGSNHNATRENKPNNSSISTALPGALQPTPTQAASPTPSTSPARTRNQKTCLANTFQYHPAVEPAETVRLRKHGAMLAAALKDAIEKPKNKRLVDEWKQLIGAGREAGTTASGGLLERPTVVNNDEVVQNMKVQTAEKRSETDMSKRLLAAKEQSQILSQQQMMLPPRAELAEKTAIERDAEIKRINQLVDERDITIRKLKGDAAAKDIELAHQKAKLLNQGRSITTSEQLASSRTTEVIQLRLRASAHLPELSKRGARITELETLVHAAAASTLTTQKARENAKSQPEAVTKEFAAKAYEITVLEKETAAKFTEIEQLRSRVNDLEAAAKFTEIEQLRSRVNDLEAAAKWESNSADAADTLMNTRYAEMEPVRTESAKKVVLLAHAEIEISKWRELFSGEPAVVGKANEISQLQSQLQEAAVTGLKETRKLERQLTHRKDELRNMAAKILAQAKRVTDAEASASKGSVSNRLLRQNIADNDKLIKELSEKLAVHRKMIEETSAVSEQRGLEIDRLITRLDVRDKAIGLIAAGASNLDGKVQATGNPDEVLMVWASNVQSRYAQTAENLTSKNKMVQDLEQLAKEHSLKISELKGRLSSVLEDMGEGVASGIQATHGDDNTKNPGDHVGSSTKRRSRRRSRHWRAGIQPLDGGDRRSDQTELSHTNGTTGFKLMQKTIRELRGLADLRLVDVKAKDSRIAVLNCVVETKSSEIDSLEIRLGTKEAAPDSVAPTRSAIAMYHIPKEVLKAEARCFQKETQAWANFKSEVVRDNAIGTTFHDHMLKNIFENVYGQMEMENLREEITSEDKSIEGLQRVNTLTEKLKEKTKTCDELIEIAKAKATEIKGLRKRMGDLQGGSRPHSKCLVPEQTTKLISLQDKKIAGLQRMIASMNDEVMEKTKACQESTAAAASKAIEINQLTTRLGEVGTEVQEALADVGIQPKSAELAEVLLAEKDAEVEKLQANLSAGVTTAPEEQGSSWRHRRVISAVQCFLGSVGATKMADLEKAVTSKAQEIARLQSRVFAKEQAVEEKQSDVKSMQARAKTGEALVAARDRQLVARAVPKTTAEADFQRKRAEAAETSPVKKNGEIVEANIMTLKVSQDLINASNNLINASRKINHLEENGRITQVMESQTVKWDEVTQILSIMRREKAQMGGQIQDLQTELMNSQELLGLAQLDVAAHKERADIADADAVALDERVESFVLLARQRHEDIDRIADGALKNTIVQKAKKEYLDGKDDWQRDKMELEKMYGARISQVTVLKEQLEVEKEAKELLDERLEEESKEREKLQRELDDVHKQLNEGKEKRKKAAEQAVKDYQNMLDLREKNVSDEAAAAATFKGRYLAK